MLLETSITNADHIDPELDQAQLNAWGLEHVRRLSRLHWTDHNIHDPGVTILELLCYVLTDLSYRAHFPIEDTLATKSGNETNMAGQFYTPRQILPSGPLTTMDYRKLLIDLPGIANAWIVSEPLLYFADTIDAKLLPKDTGKSWIRPVHVKGLFRARIEWVDDKKKDPGAVLARLLANRNLCEDFVAVDEVGEQPYSLCAELELTPEANQTEVAAQILFQVERYLSPLVHRRSLSEMLAKSHDDGSPYTVDEIFDGPALENGFIDSRELAASELRSEIRLSDIIEIVMEIEGVRAVRDIVVNALAADEKGDPAQSIQPIPSENMWVMTVPDGKRPRLSETNNRLVFYKRGMPVMAKPDKVATLLGELKLAGQTPPSEMGPNDLPIPLGNFRDPARYLTIQSHFPSVYGLSDAGLPVNATALRHAQALQLKAYLLFFDQVMANYLAQLSSVRELFSHDPSTPARTYFAQAVKFHESDLIYSDDGTERTHLLAGLLEDDKTAKVRRHRFLDHLLARVAEDFKQYVAIMSSEFSGDLGAESDTSIATKCEFLKDYPTQGAKRGIAYDYTLPPPADLSNSENVSGLEWRLVRLLGMAEFARRDPDEATLAVDTDIEDGTFRFRVKEPSTGKILLTSNTTYASREEARVDLIRTLRLAQHPWSCGRKTTDSQFFFNVVDSEGKALARRIEGFATADAMESAIDVVMTQLQSRYGTERMYIVENILLRPDPDAKDDPFLPICIDPTCTDCVDDDPYTFRLQFILPATAGRFHDMDFRRFVEETIRTETPAHILPKICWVDAAEMVRFERIYVDWLSLRAGAEKDNRKEILDAFVRTLYEVKNVYPKQKLQECGDDAKPPFVLGRIALGTES